METKLKTAPTIYPVSLTKAKQHLDIDELDTDYDDYINSIIPAAVEAAEKFMRRRLITQTWYAYLNEFPDGDRIVLPFGQLQSVTSVKYRDTDEAESTFSSSYYIVNTDTDPGQIVLGYSESWPTDTLSPSSPITIEFVCGYGDAASDVPDEIIRAIKVKIEEMFEQRADMHVGAGVNSILNLQTFARDLWGYRLYV